MTSWHWYYTCIGTWWPWLYGFQDQHPSACYEQQRGGKWAELPTHGGERVRKWGYLWDNTQSDGSWSWVKGWSKNILISREDKFSYCEEPTHQGLMMEPAFADNCISTVYGLAGPVSMLLLTVQFKRKVCPPCSTHSDSGKLRWLWITQTTVSIFFLMVVLARTCSVQLTGKEKKNKKIPSIEIAVSLVRMGPGIDTQQHAEVNWIRLLSCLVNWEGKAPAPW